MSPQRKCLYIGFHSSNCHTTLRAASLSNRSGAALTSVASNVAGSSSAQALGFSVCQRLPRHKMLPSCWRVADRVLRTFIMKFL
jgi:hypothetical protein